MPGRKKYEYEAKTNEEPSRDRSGEYHLAHHPVRTEAPRFDFLHIQIPEAPTVFLERMTTLRTSNRVRGNRFLAFWTRNQSHANWPSLMGVWWPGYI
jgi:hypothetical protein